MTPFLEPFHSSVILADWEDASAGKARTLQQEASTSDQCLASKIRAERASFESVRENELCAPRERSNKHASVEAFHTSTSPSHLTFAY